LAQPEKQPGTNRRHPHRHRPPEAKTIRREVHAAVYDWENRLFAQSPFVKTEFSACTILNTTFDRASVANAIT
jgi:hypothetical protein